MVLNLAQTLWEPMEPMNWARLWAPEQPPGSAGKDVLVLEGVVDGYFPPPAVNALAVAAQPTPLQPLVDSTLLDATALRGRTAAPAPISANQAGTYTAALAQHAAPPMVDGHYIPFELDAPKYQYRCFFEARVRTGVAVLQAPASDAFAPCP